MLLPVNRLHVLDVIIPVVLGLNLLLKGKGKAIPVTGRQGP
jgi:hypothetical protein